MTLEGFGSGTRALADGEVLEKGLTALPVAYFFSVPMIPPCLEAALRADLPRTTVSFCPPLPRVLLPILVTVSQSSMVAVECALDVG